MGKGFSYKCKNCGQENRISLGVGFIYPNPGEVTEEIKSGKHGEKLKTFLETHSSDCTIDANLELYRCKCGNVQNECHIVLRSPEEKGISNRQHCKKCGRVMKLLNELPEKIPCSKCGSVCDLDLSYQFLWD